MRSFLFFILTVIHVFCYSQKTNTVTASVAGRSGGKITRAELMNAKTVDVKGGIYSYEVKIVHSKTNTATLGTTSDKIDLFIKDEFQKAKPGTKIIFDKIKIGYTKDKNIYASPITFRLVD